MTNIKWFDKLITLSQPVESLPSRASSLTTRYERVEGQITIIENLNPNLTI